MSDLDRSRGQYSIFLFYLSNTISALGPQHRSLADRVSYLNKALNSVDLYHEVELPKIFFLDHPLGSVLGRARYSDFFSFSQNCTVANNNGVYPRLGENVSMMSGATVLGDCDIGSHWFSPPTAMSKTRASRLARSCLARLRTSL